MRSPPRHDPSPPPLRLPVPPLLTVTPITVHTHSAVPTICENFSYTKAPGDLATNHGFRHAQGSTAMAASCISINLNREVFCKSRSLINICGIGLPGVTICIRTDIDVAKRGMNEVTRGDRWNRVIEIGRIWIGTG